MENICAGIVLYNPDMLRLTENIDALISQLKTVYVIDNGSENIEQIRVLCNNIDGVFLFENGINTGVAAALNKLCNIAHNNSYEWILTLDQDSVCYDDMVGNLKKYTDLQDVGILCPLIIDDNEKNIIRSTDLFEYETVERCITSGSLMNIEVWEECGGFDEVMFIDCVDFDYCTNIILKGYKIYRINSAKLSHRIGKASEVRFFNKIGKLLGKEKLKKTLFTYNHSPERTYYYARNIIYYMKKYKGHIDTKKELKVYLKWVLLKIFFEKQRLKKICAIIKGTADAPKLYKLYLQKEKEELINL